MIDRLFPGYPREFGKKRAPVNSKDELYSKINRFNGIIDCYINLYMRESDRTPIIDKLFFDFDSDKCWENTKKFHKFLSKERYEHCINFSGGGFHVYVFTLLYQLRYPREALRAAQTELLKACGLSIGKSKKADVDEAVIGDVRRITRIPYTYNPKPHRRLFCLPLTESDFRKSLDEIKEMAKKQRFVKDENAIFSHSHEKKEVNLELYDKEPTYESIIMPTDYDIDIHGEVDMLLKQLPPLIQYLLKTCRCSYRDRYVTIMAMREVGWPVSLAIGVCQHYWSEEKFKHSHQDENQFGDLYKRKHLFFPNWNTLEREGYYVTKKDRSFSLYNST